MTHLFIVNLDTYQENSHRSSVKYSDVVVSQKKQNLDSFSLEHCWGYRRWCITSSLKLWLQRKCSSQTESLQKWQAIREAPSLKCCAASAYMNQNRVKSLHKAAGNFMKKFELFLSQHIFFGTDCYHRKWAGSSKKQCFQTLLNKILKANDLNSSNLCGLILCLWRISSDTSYRFEDRTSLC